MRITEAKGVKERRGSRGEEEREVDDGGEGRGVTRLVERGEDEEGQVRWEGEYARLVKPVGDIKNGEDTSTIRKMRRNTQRKLKLI